MKVLPEQFINSIRNVKGFDESAFLQVHSEGERVTSLRTNPAKAGIESISQSLSKQFAANITAPESLFSPVKWCPAGFYVHPRPSFTLDPLFHAGAYYVQEASSMFLWEVLKQTGINKNAQVKILDACAAPGGKTTLLSEYFTNALVVSNEVIKSRVHVLLENTTKWGNGNVIVTNNDAKEIGKMSGFFDMIIVDAPCSGSGLFRKNKEAVNEWSEQNVLLCSGRQKRILNDVLPALKTNGFLIYSTCSYAAEENEEIVDQLLSNHDLKSFQLKPEDDWGIIETQSPENNAFGYRFFPDKLKGEGFFIAAFLKNDKEIPSDSSVSAKEELKKLNKEDINIINKVVQNPDEQFYFSQKDLIFVINQKFKSDLELLKNFLYIKKAGICVGNIIGSTLIPAHELAMSTLLNSSVNKIHLNRQQALHFLKKENLEITSVVKGWALAQYQGINLGWIKILQNRINNYYPAAWRILKAND